MSNAGGAGFEYPVAPMAGPINEIEGAE